MTLGLVSEKPTFSEVFYSSLCKLPDGERIQACLQCGTCSGICPFGYLMDFPPSKMISALRAGMFDKVIKTDMVWMCVSCYACTNFCPAKIPLTPGLMTRTKEELLLAGNVPVELQDALQNTQRYGNPLGESPRKRAAWTRGLEPPVTIMSQANRLVDTLWFVGDYGSYHPRVSVASQSLAHVFNVLGVDFGILGHEESSDGDSQRLAGERGLFEMLAEMNGKAFQKYHFNRIVTADPHAYNALKNEYPKLGLSYPVQHYTQFLYKELDQLRHVYKNKINARVTYHDPCYLGRANGIFEEPRQLLNSIPGIEFVEMSHHGVDSLCCGGGGGGMWLEGFQWEQAHVRLSEWRVREAVSAGADILAVACSYEIPRFEDAAKMVQKANRLIVKDIAEILSEAIGDGRGEPNEHRGAS
jgi:Fe-S oxidoreductase